jgi:hypothetical protein
LPLARRPPPRWGDAGTALVGTAFFPGTARNATALASAPPSGSTLAGTARTSTGAASAPFSGPAFRSAAQARAARGLPLACQPFPRAGLAGRDHTSAALATRAVIGPALADPAFGG